MDGYRVEDKEPWLTSDRKRNLLELLILSGMFVVFLLLTSREKAAALSGTAAVMYALISVNARYRRETWFWVTIAALSAAHVVAIFSFSFELPNGPALSYVVPAMFGDGFAMLGIVSLLASTFRQFGPKSHLAIDPGHDVRIRQRANLHPAG